MVLFSRVHISPKNTSAASEVGPGQSFNVFKRTQKKSGFEALDAQTFADWGVSAPMQFSLCEVLYWQDFGVEILKGQAQT